MENLSKNDTDWELDHLRYLIMYDSDGNLKTPQMPELPQDLSDAYKQGQWVLPEKNGNGKNGDNDKSKRDV